MAADRLAGPRLPELLSPAGSPEALEAAISAGADAVYLGGTRFNARMNAHNFDRGALREAVTHAHRMGGRVYLTLNTLVWDRELTEALAAAYEAAEAGVDALIVADLGAAALIRASIPSLPLHASTQLSGHNAAVGRVLADFGFSRFVIARETNFSDLAAAVRSNPLEVEVFIHGALCVSHSGQCLFSSLVGGRSGNRGECAQPCRLPYGGSGCTACGNPPTRGDVRPRDRRNPKEAYGKDRSRRSPDPVAENYPLSLKDLSLAAHVPTLVEAGVSSLKIEGRMKSPGYVSGVTAIWRRLLDEGRAATPEEMTALGDLFSRGGFTDGYQTGRVDRSMMGVRSEADKDRTAAAEKAALAAKHPPRLPLSVTFTARESSPVTLTAEAPLYRWNGDFDSPPTAAVTTAGDIPTPAENPAAALTAEAAARQLSRTGGTPYSPDLPHGGITATVAEDTPLLLPLSRLNALRREALEALDTARLSAMPDPAAGYAPAAVTEVTRTLLSAHTEGSFPHSDTPAEPRLTARFHTPAFITDRAIDAFDRLFLPMGKAHPARVPVEKRGLLIPPVVFDKEADALRRSLAEALEQGVRHLTVGNLGHLPLVTEVIAAHGLTGEVTLHGDLRLNVTNTLTAARLLSQGLSDLILSPELTVPRMRDISLGLAEEGHPAATAVTVYGRTPMMLLEKCAIRETYRGLSPAAVCRDVCSRDAARLTDRLGKEFPILREAGAGETAHRNVVYNSLPLSMSDRQEEILRAHAAAWHFIFTVESPAEVDRVIEAYRRGTPLGGEVRRMVK